MSFLFDFPEGGRNGKKSGVEDKKKHNNITSDDGCPPELVKRFMRADVGGKSFRFVYFFPPYLLFGEGGVVYMSNLGFVVHFA